MNTQQLEDLYKAAAAASHTAGLVAVFEAGKEAGKEAGAQETLPAQDSQIPADETPSPDVVADAIAQGEAAAQAPAGETL